MVALVIDTPRSKTYIGNRNGKFIDKIDVTFLQIEATYLCFVASHALYNLSLFEKCAS